MSLVASHPGRNTDRYRPAPTSQHPQPAGPPQHRPSTAPAAEAPAGGSVDPASDGSPDAPGAPVCDLVAVPVRQALEAADILRLRQGVGPTLHDGPGDTLGFLVPPGTAAHWDVPGSTCIPAYHPHGAAASPATTTEPDRLRAALHEAARTLRAADRDR